MPRILYRGIPHTFQQHHAYLQQFGAFKGLADKGEGHHRRLWRQRACGEATPAPRQGQPRSASDLRERRNHPRPAHDYPTFCLADQAQQEQVFDAIQKQWNKRADAIRRMLTEKMVHAADRRAIFVTADAYKTADGIILQSLDETGDRSQQKEPGANW